MWVYSMVRMLVLASIVASALLVDLTYAQSLYSPYPSRTTILALANKPRGNATTANHIRTHTADRTVLGYVTPWNPRGTGLAERFRGKFDILSPAWHTVDVTHTGGQTFYSVGGGATSAADTAWQERLQNAAKDGDGSELAPVNIMPRFVLDRFKAEDLLELVQSDALMESLAVGVFDSVMDNGYDGAVFECAAVWVIEPLVKAMAERLHQNGKKLAVVIPALRNEGDKEVLEHTNKISIHAMRTLSPLADYTMVMTYDHAGRQGRAYGNVYDITTLPEGSPMRQDGVRTPGPNTPLEYLEHNIEQLTADLEVVTGGPQFAMGADTMYSNEGAAEKLLVGLPLYGYTYSIGWFDNAVTASQSVPRLPPTSPLAAKDNDTDAQAASRAKAEKREQDTPNVVPLQRFAGEPFKHEDLVAQLRLSKALIRLDESSQEQMFDYVAALPPSIAERQKQKSDGVDGTLKTETGAMASYFRAYFPSAYTMRKRLQVIGQTPGVGIALWDIGQAGEWLLHEL